MPLLKDVKLFGVYNDDNVAVDENNLIYIWKKKHKKPVELKSWTTFIRMS
jgi:myosin-5